MTSEQILGTIIFLVAALIVTVAFRMWRNHVIKQEYERFAEKPDEQDVTSQENSKE